MDRRHFLDKGRARFLAGMIGVLALTGLAFTWHKYESTDAAGRTLAGVQSPQAQDIGRSANPKFRECQEKRTSDIGKMLSDGVIDQAKHNEFLARAIQTCAGMFPPEG